MTYRQGAGGRPGRRAAAFAGSTRPRYSLICANNTTQNASICHVLRVLIVVEVGSCSHRPVSTGDAASVDLVAPNREGASERSDPLYACDSRQCVTTRDEPGRYRTSLRVGFFLGRALFGIYRACRTSTSRFIGRTSTQPAEASPCGADGDAENDREKEVGCRHGLNYARGVNRVSAYVALLREAAPVAAPCS